MIQVNNLAIQFGKKPLFQDVNLTFTQGNRSEEHTSELQSQR